MDFERLSSALAVSLFSAAELSSKLFLSNISKWSKLTLEKSLGVRNMDFRFRSPPSEDLAYKRFTLRTKTLNRLQETQEVEKEFIY